MVEDDEEEREGEREREISQEVSFAATDQGRWRREAFLVVLVGCRGFNSIQFDSIHTKQIRK